MLNNYFRISILSAAFALPFSLAAQQTNTVLPAGFAPGEKEQFGDYVRSLQQPLSTQGVITTPPGGNLRTMAEWEEIQALTITWTSYQSTLREIVRYAVPETKVYIIAAASDTNSIKNTLTSNSIPLTNVRFIVAPYNSIWMRDYGQNTVYKNDVDSLMIVDWIYNRPRPKDDTVPRRIAAKLNNIPVYETSQAPYDIVHTGGNFMSDGFGTAFSSELVVDENQNHTLAEIDTTMRRFMGINRYIKMPTLPYDGIHHIDMHMKLLDEQTLLVGQYPVGVADGPQIEANLQYVLSNFNSKFGTPYKVIRIPQPPDQFGDYPDQNGSYCTYSNAVFVNKTVILPLYYQQYDTTALRIWQEALPGYKIRGINCNSIIQASGAIHCITHSVGVTDPLLISHQALPNTTNTVTPYQVDAFIKHKSGIQSATLYYTTDTSQPYLSVPMTLTNVAANTWTGYIPAQLAGTSVFYYIEGTSVSGKVQVRPMPAPLGYWKFDVIGTLAVNSPAAQLVAFQPAYPNPSHGITCIPVSLGQIQRGSLRVTDMLGRELGVIFDGEMPAGEKNYFINTLGMEAGVYHLVLQTETGGRAVQQLLVR